MDWTCGLRTLSATAAGGSLKHRSYGDHGFRLRTLLHLQYLRLPHKLRRIEQEAFLKCTSLTEVSVPPTLLYIARRAFAGCTQLYQFQRVGKRRAWRGTYSRANAFLKCDNLDMPMWVRWLPRNRKDEDQWADDSFAVLN